MADPREALGRLRAAGSELAEACERYQVDLLVAFGSAVRSGPDPNDLDIAARFATAQPDLLGFLDVLSALAETSRIDLMDLGRALPVAKERALVGGDPLHEGAPGAFARAQMAAMTERMDTDWLRRIDLELMAERA
jgi:predicted nucleotidyltransferase